MAISVVRPVDDKWEITGEIFQDWGYWTPDHPHFGVDFGCPKRTPVKSATIRGSVFAIHNAPLGQWMGDFGLCVVVKVYNPETKETWYYLYAHLDSVAVSLGQIVNPGDLIGMSGDSGNVDGEHLHVQVSSSPQFARNRDETGDPILGLRGAVVPQPPPVPPAAVTIADVNNSLNNLNTIVGVERLANETRDRENKARDEALDSRLSSIERGIQALVNALPKG